MNAIVARTGGTGLISREDLAKSLNNAAMAMPSVGGDMAFLKMDKSSGDWLFGQEETVVEDTSLWAANPLSLKHGWVAWDTNGGGAPVQEIMVSALNRPLPAQDSLPVLGTGTPDKKSGRAEQLTYQQQRSVELTCVLGDDAGTTVEYKQSSTGAMKLFGVLINAILDQASKGDEFVPVGKLTFDSYKHKQYGKINNPIFQIVEWRTADDASPVEDKPEPEPEPVSRRRAAAPVVERTVVGDPPKEELGEEDAALKAEYEAAAAENPAPRRRVRR
jgi:hypothetical protein